MITIFKIILVVVLVLGLYVFITRNYVNPYKLIFLFGKKGSGKTTLLTKLTYRYATKKKKWHVFSTEVLDPADPKYKEQLEVQEWLKSLGVKYIDPTKIYDFQFPWNSCILIDEVSLIWPNRNFKNMDPKIIEWFRYQRQHGCRVYFFSQSFDIDKKLRDLTDDMYLVNKYLRVFVVASHIVRKPVVVHPGPESPARIDDDMVVDGPLLTFFGGKLFAFIPYWRKKFVSHKFKTEGEEVAAEYDD